MLYSIIFYYILLYSIDIYINQMQEKVIVKIVKIVKIVQTIYKIEI
jgi:hypothetical protein